MPFCAYCGQQVAAVSYAPCPRCANPTNGAPRPVVVPAQTDRKVLVIVGVLAAVLLIVPITGIIAAIAIPNLLTAMPRSRQKRTMADMRSVAVAAEAYALDHKDYPKDGTMDVLMPTYVRVLPRVDGWGHPFRFECWSTTGEEKCDAFAIASSGKDGAFERSSLKEYPSGQATTNFNADIVFASGSFIQYPQGAQQ